MVAIAVVRPNLDDNLLSRQWNCVHLNDAKEKRCLADSTYFKDELSFRYDEIKILQKSFRSAPTGRVKKREKRLSGTIGIVSFSMETPPLDQISRANCYPGRNL
jgi:hypothetical protein